jgi:AbiV family abortive infection protein
MSDALLAIARNAVALLDDAEFLFANGRYSRAASLAILAAEEAGKFWLLDMKPEGWQRMLDRHPDKIGIGARFHEAEKTAGTVLGSTVGMVETFAGASSEPEYEQWHERAKAFLPRKEAGLYVDLDRAGGDRLVRLLAERVASLAGSD